MILKKVLFFGLPGAKTKKRETDDNVIISPFAFFTLAVKKSQRIAVRFFLLFSEKKREKNAFDRLLPPIKNNLNTFLVLVQSQTFVLNLPKTLFFLNIKSTIFLKIRIKFRKKYILINNLFLLFIHVNF